MNRLREDTERPMHAPENSVAGLGVDIVEIARMKRILERTPRFAQRVFSAAEREYCEQHHKPHMRYATHFAAKEAVLKALGTGFSQGIGFTDVEVGHDRRGRPVAVLHGRAAQIAAEQGVLELHLSLSRTHDTAIANAVAVTQAIRPVREERPDPRAQLSSTFKELRGMLDEMDGTPADGGSAATAAGDERGGEHE